MIPLVLLSGSAFRGSSWREHHVVIKAASVQFKPDSEEEEDGLPLPATHGAWARSLPEPGSQLAHICLAQLPPSQHIQRDELVANQLFVNSGFLVTALFRSENGKDAISAPDQPQDHPPLQTT